MNVFKEYNNICLTTVLLISSFSNFAVAVCTLPTELHNSVWNYQFTDLSNNAQTTTLTFGRTTLTKPSNIRLNALGTTLNAWTCISNLTLSSAVSVAVFKSDESYSDFKGVSKWVYLCMKLTKVADDLFYFYLLSDADWSVYPKERVYQSGRFPDNTAPVCSTFCQYTTKPRIRTLKKSGTSTTLPSDVSLCEPCDSACEEATTDITSLESTQNITFPSTFFESDITTDIPSTETIRNTTIQITSTEVVTTTETTLFETTQQTTAQSTSNEMMTSTETTPLETTQKTTTQSTSYDIMTTTEMKRLETTQKTTAQSTYTEMDTTTEKQSTDTTPKTTLPSTSTEIDITTEIAPKETAQRTTLPASSTNLVITIQKTTMDTQSTDRENWKTNSGPIIIIGIASVGSSSVVIIFVNLKRQSRVNTSKEDTTTSEKGETEVWIFYKGEHFEVQKIAI